ncbi:hypothetical protein [Arthrobacter sp. A2-55]|uniref:hypothetical protein n=1 Tax=Arthrobacter sp. A2-55 TaxID=2897337 RepID=UPI0021CD6A97|nr:hypothetical protein [Arthrobacter sp. A2-55]MCU6481930.1 hypothetical protein [Arthrobacter sp. A2-55]
MSYKIMRVPLDFTQPLNEAWAGYTMPPSPTCTTCQGSGDTGAFAWLYRLGELRDMLAEDIVEQRRDRPIHPYLSALRNKPTEYMSATLRRPSEDILEFLTGLTGLPVSDLTHWRGLDRASLKGLLKASGVGPTWGWCKDCEGKGHLTNPETEGWTPTEPPSGPGWQLWETITLGSPVSPVFPTGDELARHMAETGFTPAEAQALVESGWAPSGIIAGGRMHDDKGAALALQRMDNNGR